MPLKDDVAHLVDDEGRAMTLRRVSTGAYSPSTSSATITSVEHTVKGFLLNYRDDRREDSLVKMGDRKAVIKAKGLAVAPQIKDLLIVDNREFQIVNTRIIEQKGETVVYICQIRG